MDWKRREITHHYNLRSLRGPRLRSRTRDQRNINTSNSRLQPPYYSSRNTTQQQQHRRDRSQRERTRNRSQGDNKRNGSQQRRRMNSTRRAHKALSGIPASSDKPDEDESEDIKCIICLDTVDDTDMKYVRCGHSFHRTCCNNWLKVNNACPMCRTVVAPRRFCVESFNHETLIDDTPISEIIYFFTLSVMGDLDL